MTRRKIKAFNRYMRCSDCGKVFRVKFVPLGEVRCPRCGSVNVVDADRKEWLEARRVVK